MALVDMVCPFVNSVNPNAMIKTNRNIFIWNSFPENLKNPSRKLLKACVTDAAYISFTSFFQFDLFLLEGLIMVYLSISFFSSITNF
jgi:hypothetical protein